MQPRILFIDQSGELGGAELVLLDIAVHYRGSSATVLLSDGPLRERLAAAGATATVVPMARRAAAFERKAGLLSALGAAPAMASLILRLRRVMADYDLVFANTQKALILGAIAARLAGKPLVWYLHDILDPAHFSRLSVWAATRCANFFARRVLANSRASALAFAAAGGRRRTLAVVPVGIAAEAFGQSDNGFRSRLRAEIGAGDAPLLGSFSRLSPWKGQHVLLDALAELPGVHAIIVGDALFGEGRYAADLRSRATALGLDERVHFLGFRSDIPQLLEAVDIVVHTATAPEPFGRVLVEGMLSGRPVIATAAGGACEIIEDHRTGLLVPAGEAAALADAVRRVIRDPALASRLAASGRQRAREAFSLDGMLRGIDEQIRQVWQPLDGLAPRPVHAEGV